MFLNFPLANEEARIAGMWQDVAGLSGVQQVQPVLHMWLMYHDTRRRVAVGSFWFGQAVNVECGVSGVSKVKKSPEREAGERERISERARERRRADCGFGNAQTRIRGRLFDHKLQGGVRAGSLVHITELIESLQRVQLRSLSSLVLLCWLSRSQTLEERTLAWCGLERDNCVGFGDQNS